MASTRRYCSSIFIIFMASFIHLQSSKAYQFNVGGRAGWIVNPPENYNDWAGRTRFQVNDTLFFKYEKGSNSVFQVNRDDYSQCNTNNPILRLEDGNSIFKFDRSGPFYFISGNKTFCDQGQKIIIVVLAIRNKTPPATPPPAGQPPALPPAPSISPVSPPQAGQPPALPPAPIISPVSPPLSPVSTPPSNASTPPSSPVSSPPPPSSSETPPPPPPSSESPPLTPPGSVPPPPSGSNENSGSGASARPGFSPSTVLMLAVSIVFSMTLSAPIFF